ncbi:hypothetical protein PV325_009935 [Microctonus aethiopoides]|uniref:RNA helicase n=1 Tax=Microctonus aethiopoides TaxID=144406 RepID=A0AA39FMU3_9HYME|nr:hypothetical protein PV325_009935 [Microctonus aethiopoides]KAK0172326.1 hypothetical protein PV328_005660 [Microctonus aethiopoides]
MTPNLAEINSCGTSQYTIPPPAIQVRIHNILNPYIILVSDLKESENMLEVINEKLLSIMKQAQNLKKNKKDEKYKPGTIAIVHRKTPDGVDLPAWYSRAIIIKYNEETSKYITFLPDYGEHLELSHESFVALEYDIINIPYVTYIIAMYEILPVRKRKFINQKKIELVVEKDWHPQSFDLTMQLVSSSTKTFFHHITTQTNGIKCGELYLMIDGQIVPLRKALIQAHFAIYLTNDLLTHQITINSSKASSCSDTNESTLSFDRDSKYSDITKAKRNVFHEILVSSNVECNRLNNIADARFDSSVLGALKNLSITHLRRLQSYVWPAINKGLDVLAVGPQKCGKTIGYAAPIASIIINTVQYQVEHYPMALILCSSSSQVLYIHSIFEELLSNFKNIKIIGACNGCTDRSILAGIMCGHHIFISTPAFLVRFFERNEHHRKELKFEHISHLVIDDFDVILDKHTTALTQLLGRYTLVGKKNLQHTNILALQLVAAAQQWSTTIGRFIKIFTNPYICIGSFADAAIFCGIQLRPRLVIRDKKKFKIAELLSDHYRMVKTMIVCANSDEADELNEYLSDKFKVLYVHKKMLFTEIIDIKESWDTSVSGTYPVLICFDEVLSNLKITDVHWLIHYSVAVSSKSTFLFRFSTLMSNLKRRSRKVEVTVFIDDTNNLQFRGIMDMIKRSGTTISPELLHIIERVSVTIERDKKGSPICNNIKSFGYCPKSGKCNYRHCILPEIDAPSTPLAIGDRMNFIITYVHNATHFSARITEYIDYNNEKHELSDVEHIKITTKVLHHYSNKNNRHRSREIIVGGIYAFDDSFDTYQRVQVVEIVTKDDKDDPLHVNLRCIDSGITLNRVRASQLLEMPKELAEAPAHIIEVFLANLLPYDDESEWNRRANECTHQWFSDQLGVRNAFLQGKVCLHLGNTIWVNPLEVRTKIVGYPELVSGSLASHLIKQKFGIMNREHMILLRKLCSNAGMIDSDELSN